jgi:glucose-6-phosphate dehydrogenase assembly protein OpcA
MPDTPVVTWWPGTPPEIPASSALGTLAQRRITDAAAAAMPHDCLSSLASHYSPGDTDLSWTRATPWRSLLAATLDQPHGTIQGGRVEAERGNPSAELIASWLSVRLGAPFENRVSGGPGVTAVVFDTSDGEMTLTRPDGRLAMLRRPGEPERRVALHRRDTAELLSEELRRLDPDEVYAETIASFVPAPAEVKRNGGSSRKRATSNADAARKDNAR